MTPMRRNDVASTSFRRHVPTRFLIIQSQIITFLILKSDIIENSRIELRGKVLPVSSNQIKVAFIIGLPFNLVHLWFFPVSHRNWRKMWVDYWGVKGYVGPPYQIIGGGGGAWPPCSPPLPTPENSLWTLSVIHSLFSQCDYVNLDHAFSTWRRRYFAGSKFLTIKHSISMLCWYSADRTTIYDDIDILFLPMLTNYFKILTITRNRKF